MMDYRVQLNAMERKIDKILDWIEKLETKGKGYTTPERDLIMPRPTLYQMTKPPPPPLNGKNIC
jgi:hypothetical protein